jgi:uncharacterized lipoprotein YddW (UPF0748 family)
VHLIINTIKRATIVALLFLSHTLIYCEIFDVRALWVVRDHIITKEKLDEVLSFAEANNYNHLFIQIRGRGDAYYNSKLVPRSHLLKDTNFNPLAYVIKKTRHSSIKIHAWFNVYYLWSSSEKPSQSDHLLFTHPEWLDTKYPDPLDIGQTLDDIRRNRNPNEEGIYLAPTHPEVEAHLQNILTELLQNYHLDGIHFDYVRYQDLGWGLNPVGMKYFFQYSGSLPGLPALEVQGKPSFSDFKNAAITQFIHKASRRIKAYQPDCIVSAAVKPNLFKAQNNFGQKWYDWLASGYLDWAVPMNYATDMNTFNENLKIMKDNIPPEYHDKIIMGIATYNQDPEAAGRKIYQTGKNDFGGISIFSFTVFKDEPSYASKLLKYFQ